jgi:shikimate dehydrogenase
MEAFCVIGNPIKHSLSPAMHNSQFMELGINATYSAFNVREDDLETAVEGIKSLNIKGFNVTIPHKESIIKYLDELDNEAKAIGAVNTIVNKNNKLIGTNTDGIGFVNSILDFGFSLDKKSVLVIGAGGASRAIIYTLAKSGISSITLANRTTERAINLLNETNLACQANVVDIIELPNVIGNFDLVVNTTSVGMSPNIDEIPFAFEKVKEGSHFVDIIYNPFHTALLNKAKSLGATVQNGIGMFVHQGALAFELWTGQKPNIKNMEKIVLERLGEKNNANR